MGESIKEVVKERYEDAGRCGSSKYCCAPQEKYSKEDLEGVPGDILALSSSCGNPVSLAQIGEGEVVVDIGCGAGLDLFLAARRVGPTGRVIGIDSSPSMLARARVTFQEAGIRSAEFHEGTADSLPLADGTADVVLSNCVLCTMPDKERVLKEMFRVLKPSGRAVISDVVTPDGIPGGTPGAGGDAEAWAACLVGVSPDAYLGLLMGAGFEDLQVLERSSSTFRDGSVVESMVVLARKPCGCAGGSAADPASVAAPRVILGARGTRRRPSGSVPRALFVRGPCPGPPSSRRARVRRPGAPPPRPPGDPPPRGAPTRRSRTGGGGGGTPAPCRGWRLPGR